MKAFVMRECGAICVEGGEKMVENEWKKGGDASMLRKADAGGCMIVCDDRPISSKKFEEDWREIEGGGL